MKRPTLAIGRSLQAKIMSFICLTILLSIGISTLLYIRDFRSNYLEAVEWRSESLAQQITQEISARYRLFGAEVEPKLLLESAYLQVNNLFEANHHLHVTGIGIFDPTGRIITHNDQNLWGRRLDDAALLQALSKDQTCTLLLDDQYHTLIPIQANDDTDPIYIGAIDIGFPKAVVDQKIHTHIKEATHLCLTLFLLASLLIWLFIRRLVTRPITNLISATKDLAAGDLHRDIPIDQALEFEQLSLSLAHMRDALRNNIRTIEQKSQEVRALIACSPVALFSIDSKGEVSIWTTSAQRLFGWQGNEVLGKPLPTVPPEEEQRFAHILTEVFQGQVLRGIELRQQQKDGTQFHASLSTAPIEDSQGQIIGAMAAMEDISMRIQRDKEHQEIQERFLHAQKMESVGRLAGGVAHDYNNTLGVILGYAEILLEGLPPDDPRRNDLQQIIRATNHSADITRQLLAFARKQTISPKTIDLNLQVEKTLRMLRRLIGEDIDLEWLPDDRLKPVHMDPTQIDQILANLCINARDAMPNGGHISIETHNQVLDAVYCSNNPGFRPGNYVCLSVSDNGIGMDQNLLRKIFEPFFTTKSKGEGTGLGLATVYGIVKQNQGFINVYSEPGKGSTFNVYLQPHDGMVEHPSQLAVASAADSAGNGQTILVVEDEEPILDLCHQILETLGYRVLSSSDPIAALDLARQTQPPLHLLITDVIMPGMNGQELAQRVNRLHPETRTLFMSGYTANIIAHHGVLDGSVNFISKPFSRDVLAGKVRHALTRTYPATEPIQE